MTRARESLFWRKLADAHRSDLDSYGLERIKRRQAFRYFNWSWRWRTLRESEQMRFLLSHTPVRAWLRCLAAPPVRDDREWEGAPLGRRDRWLYTWSVRLLWTYAEAYGDPDVLRLAEPALGGPLPVHLGGRLISQDLANTSLEVAAIRRALGGRRPRRVLEIGAGYGRTAFALLALFPEASYTIVDIPPALDISRWYLEALYPDRDLAFVDAGDSERLPDAGFDLALSISSLQEMLPAEIERYLRLVDRTTRAGIVYLKQRAEWHNPDDRLTTRFDDYPIPERWRLLDRRAAPVQTSFTEAAWEIP